MSCMNDVGTASETTAEYFDWHPELPFRNDYIRWFAPGDALRYRLRLGLGWIVDHVDNYAGIDSSQSSVPNACKMNRNVIHGSD